LAEVEGRAIGQRAVNHRKVTAPCHPDAKYGKSSLFSGSCALEAGEEFRKYMARRIQKTTPKIQKTLMAIAFSGNA
jgi:hypothetical protein